MDLVKPKNLSEAMELSQMLATATVIPKEYQNNPANVFVALQAGMGLGLGVWQSMQSISIINGKPTIWGDTVLGLVRKDKRCLAVEETVKKIDDDKDIIATCKVKRQQEDGIEIIERSFKWSDAVRAGLTGRGPWKQYPERMLKMRARGFALRDAFPDVLNGLITSEEADDFNNAGPSLKQSIEMKNANATGRNTKSIVDKLKSDKIEYIGLDGVVSDYETLSDFGNMCLIQVNQIVEAENIEDVEKLRCLQEFESKNLGNIMALNKVNPTLHDEIVSAKERYEA